MHLLLRYSLLGLLVTALGCVDVPSLTTGSNALLGAPVDPSHEFSVGVCTGPLVPNGELNAGACATFSSTGTLVAPNLVLTARHSVRQISFAEDNFCSSKFTDEPLASPVRVTISPSVRTGNPQWLDVQAILVPSDRNLCEDDIALLVLAKAVPSSVTPAHLDAIRDLASSPPAEVAIVGRGGIKSVTDLATGELTTFDNGLAFRRLAEHVPFNCAVKGKNVCVVEDFSSTGNTFEAPSGLFVVGQATAEGDSGAAIFDQASFNTTNSPAVIGVVTLGTIGADGQPNHGLGIRLTKHRDFLIASLTSAARAMSSSPATFISTVE